MKTLIKEKRQLKKKICSDVKWIQFINQNQIFILYSNYCYQVYDLPDKKITQGQLIHNSFYAIYNYQLFYKNALDLCTFHLIQKKNKLIKSFEEGFQIDKIIVLQYHVFVKVRQKIYIFDYNWNQLGEEVLGYLFQLPILSKLDNSISVHNNVVNKQKLCVRILPQKQNLLLEVPEQSTVLQLCRRQQNELILVGNIKQGAFINIFQKQGKIFDIILPKMILLKYIFEKEYFLMQGVRFQKFSDRKLIVLNTDGDQNEYPLKDNLFLGKGQAIQIHKKQSFIYQFQHYKLIPKSFKYLFLMQQTKMIQNYSLAFVERIIQML